MEFMDPEGTEWAMKRNLKSKIKIQEKVLLKDQLICLKGIGSNKAQCFAFKICKKIKHDKEKAIERVLNFIMNMKIEDAKRDIENDKKLQKEEQHEFEKSVRPNTFVGREYSKVVKRKLETNWKVKKEKSKNKVNHLKEKYHKYIKRN